MKARSKFENKVLVSFAAAIVMILAIAATMWKASHDALEAARWVSHTLETLDSLADARADLYRIESSVRGYLVSENPARLAERDAAISSLETVLQRIRELIGNDSRQTERWKRLRDAVDARLATHTHTVTLRKNQGIEAAREYIANTPQREVVRQGSIELLDEMEAEERRLLQERDIKEKRLRKIAIAAALAVTLVLVGLLAATYVLIREQFAYSRAARERSDEAARARKALLDAADVAIISVDPEGVIRSFNPAAEHMLGYAAAELVDSQTPAVVHDPGEIVARARQFSEELGETIAPGFEVFVAKTRRNLPNAHEWTYVRKDGGRMQVLLSVSTMRDGAGRVIGFLGVATDITKRKEAEQALVAAKNAAELANRAKDSFLATMSHEIRTPLNGMLGMLELLGFSRLDGEQREALEAARDSGRSLVRIIDDVLDHARIEAGKLEVRAERVSIAQLLRRVVNTYSAVASTKGLMLRQIADPRISPALLADPLRVMQILGNLVSNAVKFTAEGYVEVRAELIAREDGADTVRLSVKDTGIGIAPEARRRLFRPFEQAATDTSRLYGGTGLGLSISRRLAEMMGGAIDVESTLGEGTNMSVTLTLPISNTAPAEDASEAAALLAPASAAQAVRAAPREGALVLAVDDHPINRNLLARQLTALGLRAQTAADGREALALWQGGEFALMIVDCNMPVMDGYAFSRAVRDIEAREGRPRAPIIAWTANVFPDAAARCHAAGMDDILTKPVELTALKEALAKWIPAATASSSGPVFAGSESAGATLVTPIDYGELDKIATNATDRTDILQDFMAQTQSDLAELEVALKNKDLAACGRIAHRMKGASRMVGARELAAESEALEKTARQSGPKSADGVKAALQRIVAHLAEPGGTNKEKP